MGITPLLLTGVEYIPSISDIAKTIHDGNTAPLITGAEYIPRSEAVLGVPRRMCPSIYTEGIFHCITMVAGLPVGREWCWVIWSIIRGCPRI
jgi:hypothetical protein